MPRKQHIKVRTADVLKTPDMVRYIDYAHYGELPGSHATDYDLNHLVFEPESAEPVKVKWRYSTVTLHRFQEGEYTYFRCPSGMNNNWGTMGIARWKSFGVRADTVLR